MSHENILAMVVAGKSSCLSLLAANRAMHDVLVGGSYRLVDFALSNLVNSGINSIYLLAQHDPGSLRSHVQDNWDLFSSGMDGFVHVAPPGSESALGYLGNADAVRKNLVLIERHAPSVVAVFSENNICRVDVRQMLDFHNARNADATILATRIPVAGAADYGNLLTGGEGEVIDFQDRPEWPYAMTAWPGFAHVSTGNYLFNTEVLVGVLEGALDGTDADFGRHILPRLARTHCVYAYDLENNYIPGAASYEERAYWREIGALEDYAAVHCDLVGQHPRFDLQNLYWPILPARFSPPPSFRGGHPCSYVMDYGNLAARLHFA